MKLTLKQQRLVMSDLVIDTVKFYDKSPTTRRSKHGDECMYSGAGNTSCAVGKCLLDSVDKAKLDVGSDTSVSGVDDVYGLDNLLKKKYRGLNIDFWEDLQDLHDDSYYWTMDSISGDGLVKIDIIKNKHKLSFTKEFNKLIKEREV